MKKIRVLIVEDSDVVKALLEHIIDSDPRLEVAAIADSAEEAIEILDRVNPDVISMDIRLPGMNGFEATRKIMSKRPTPIVVVSASVEAEDLKITMNALRAGALSVVEKPRGFSHKDYERVSHQLCTQLVIMSEVKLVRQHYATVLPLRDIVKSTRQLAVQPETTSVYRALGVVASTGGPGALVELLGGLGDAFPIPIFLVQHITGSFLTGFVTWLDSICPMRTKIPLEGESPRPGVVYVAPADQHLQVSHGRLTIDGSPQVSLQRPSGTVLFRSMAQCYNEQSIGVLLTGMGEDGAEGLLEMRKAGAYTIAESKATAVIYGMPAAAAEIGAARVILPLDAIASRVKDLVSDQKGQ